MNHRFALFRLIALSALAIWLGYIVHRDPGLLTQNWPARGVSITVPQDLEGWQIHPGQGDVLLTGNTLLHLFSLEITQVAATSADLDTYIDQRHAEAKQGKKSYIVWHRGSDSKFGFRPAPTYKATYQDRLVGLPLMVEYWLYEVYWPYRDQYVRISMRYPDFLAAYVQPDRYMLAAGLTLDR